MLATNTTTATLVRTERGLTLTETRITLSDILSYLAPPLLSSCLPLMDGQENTRRFFASTLNATQNGRLAMIPYMWWREHNKILVIRTYENPCIDVLVKISHGEPSHLRIPAECRSVIPNFTPFHPGYLVETY